MPMAVQKRKPKSSPSRRGWEVAGICALLAAIVFIVFGRTIGYGFINFDDAQYVFENPVVSKGFSLAGVGWAFTHVVAGHWQPLTVIVLMLNSQVFGIWPGGYHLLNVLLHTAGAVLLFLFLLEMTGARWRSAFVAAVWAIHPLRVESVAWISECKDVLCGVFFMLTLLAYVRYVERPGKGRYGMVLAWFALGLMSKPMLVTLPCVMLLLDCWPLGRLRTFSQFPKLFLEKAPLFALSALSSMATVLALKSGTAPISTYPWNAPVAYATYLVKLIYPADLAVYYPIPREGWPPWDIMDAIFLLVALTMAVWFLRRSHPYLLIGWLWYLGMIVPVAGVMQTGGQAYADRYTYLPQIGIYLAVTWLAADWAGESRNRRILLGCAAGAILCAVLAAAWHQVGYWHDSETLWLHALESTRDNSIAHDDLGNALYQQGHIEQGIAEYREALEIDPKDPEAHYNLGTALLDKGYPETAIGEFRAALRVQPDYAKSHYNLGNALLQLGHVDDAIVELRAALRSNPDYAEAHGNLGMALLSEGRFDDAIAESREALRIKPAYAEAHNNLGNALFKQGHVDDAIAEYRAALIVDPRDAEAHNNLGSALFTQGRYGEAISEFGEAVRLMPDYVAARHNLEAAQKKLGSGQK